MKVNMTPNPLDVVTIHASQGDTEARQWEFELHNNGELIDTSGVTDQMVFKAYKGGTEQLLPENTSTPTTSPFKGDIKYPQGLLSDQEFTYRQSPTESDGLAKITDIKGNTLVWNQLVQNGNFASTRGWGQGGGRSTLSVENNVGTATLVNSLSTTYQNYGDVQLVQGHKILIHYEFKLPRASQRVFGCENNNTDYMFGDMRNVSANTWHTVNVIHTVVLGGAEKITICYFTTSIDGYQLGDQYQVKNLMVFDLTQMGLDISSPSDFISLFPLPYYDYNQGTLLSFNGEQIKTVGKNLFDKDNFTFKENKILDDNGNEIGFAGLNYVLDYIEVLSNVIYIQGSLVDSSHAFRVYFYDSGKNWISRSSAYSSTSIKITVTAPTNTRYIRFQYVPSVLSDVMISNYNFDSYEPYTSSTLSLPISTYFPTGMKDVPDYANGGKIYDEWTPSKAITRVNMVDLGSLPRFYYTPPTSDKPIAQFFAELPNALSGVNANVRCALYTASSSPVYGRDVDKTVCTFNGRVYICDSAYTDATAFKTAMSGVYLVYPSTPTETSFTTASLVTENAEIPLSNEDGVLIGKCTEELSAEPGFHDAKIKLSDGDGTCYSNKIQLHVERSPQ